MSINTPAPVGTNHRRRQLLTLSAIIVAAGIALFLYWFLHARFYEATEDAYVAGNVVQIAAQVSGTVTTIKTDDTQLVQAGQQLLTLDAADAQVGMAQAEAALAQAVRKTRELFINNDSLQAALSSAETSLQRSQEDLQRRQAGIATGAVSQEDLSHAQDASKSAAATLKQARSALSANQALTDKTSVADHPNVLQAAAQVRSAYLTLSRVSVAAPITGFVSKRSVQVGQRIAAGTPLMAIVPLEQIWIDANFKEVQLTHIRVGQAVEVISDIYGPDVVYHGTVQGLAAGTGGAFALLPAQNATGNWIKVVQRVPVRIALDPQEVKTHPLRIGLSITATVDLRSEAKLAVNRTDYQTGIYKDVAAQADEIVRKIVRQNSAATNAASATPDHSADTTTSAATRS